MLNREALNELLRDLPRGRHSKDVGKAQHAYFESPENVLATSSLKFNVENSQAKIFLGVINGRIDLGQLLPDGRVNRFVQAGEPIGIGDDRHHFLLAGSRGGKGRCVLGPNLVLAPATRSILCIDTKGDLARATARWRAEYLKQKVGILDPAGASGDVAKDYAVKLNPMNSLARCHEQRMVPAARLIADAIIVEGELPDPHWDITAGHFLSGLSVHVATYSAYKKFRDLVMVRDLIMQATRPDPHNPKRYKLESEMLANGAAGGFVAKAAMEFYDRAPGEFSSVLSNLRKHTEWIDYQFMSDTLRGDGIDLRDLKEKSLALYVVVRAGDMAALRGWQRLIIQLALAAHEETTEQYGPATLFIMDEFHNLSRMKQIESAAAQIAGFGCQLMPVLQDLSQLKALYPNSWETFAANSGVIQTFATADYTSCEYISKLLGSTPTVSHASHAPTFEQATKHAATGESWSIGSSPLLAPEEVMRFFARDDKLLRQLILRPGYRPIIAQRVFLDRHQLFTGKFDK